MTSEQLSAWANVPDDEPFVYRTRSEQRLDWLKSRKRPLTDEESDELYRVLHAIYTREWKRHRAEQEARHQAQKEDTQQNASTLLKVLEEANVDWAA